MNYILMISANDFILFLFVLCLGPFLGHKIPAGILDKRKHQARVDVSFRPYFLWILCIRASPNCC